MLPGYVADLEDYWRWLDGVIEGSGGWLEDSALIVQVDDEDRPSVLVIPRQRLKFYDGSYLEFRLTVTADLVERNYRFHYSGPDDSIVWRFDDHPNHPGVNDLHVHLPGGGCLSSPERVTLAEALEHVKQAQSGVIPLPPTPPG